MVLSGGMLAVLICEDLCYRSFSAQTAQFSFLVGCPGIFIHSGKVFLPLQLFRFTLLTTLNLTTSSDL